MRDILELKIDTDKEIYKTGDEIIIGYRIKNISKKEIRILPWGSHYKINWIDIYDVNNKKMEEVKLLIYELKIIPERVDFISLGPSESFKTTLKGVVKKNGKVGIKSSGQYEEIQGLLFDFSDSAIIFGSSGEYIIRAVYEGEDFWKEEGEKRYNFTNIWTGKIESNDVKIRIVE